MEAAEQSFNINREGRNVPTIHSLVGMGIIFLLGMMTWQILGGASPMVAIEYQIAIMLGIVGSVSLSVLIFVQFAYTTFFNQRHLGQLQQNS